MNAKQEGPTMNIGIIVHSQTGNTFSVAKRLEKALGKAGHIVKLERLKTVEEYKQGKPINFEALPDLGEFEAVIFGAWVEGFSLSGPMKEYMKRMESLKGKKVACFVTKALPFNWTGGNRAVSTMKKGFEKKGGKVVGTGIVIWREKRREERITAVVERFVELFR